MKRIIALVVGLFSASLLQAGQVTIHNVFLQETHHGWRAEVTIQHDDNGWEHYADAWRLVDESGRLIATRVLYHPHDERPFTRSKDGIQIPAGSDVIYVEAHDKVHGWSKQRVRVDLTRSSGEHYHVRRK